MASTEKGEGLDVIRYLMKLEQYIERQTQVNVEPTSWNHHH